MLAYDRAQVEDVPDETREVVEGLVHLAEFTLSRAAERHLTREQVLAACKKRVFVKNSAILAAIQLACPEGTLATSSDQLAAPRLGRIMRRLRFEGQRAPTVERTRGFTLSIEEILRLSRAYRVPTVLDRLLPRRQ
jgi:hypothetical protein